MKNYLICIIDRYCYFLLFGFVLIGIGFFYISEHLHWEEKKLGSRAPASLSWSSCPKFFQLLNSQCVFKVQANSLREKAEARGFLVGVAVNDKQIFDNGKNGYTNRIIRHFNIITPENAMKWKYLSPQEGQYNFSRIDKLLDFATKYQQQVRGHTLVWYNSIPDWFKFGNYGPQKKESLLVSHIQTVIQHFTTNYPGVVTQWDVVNEAMDENGTLRNTIYSNIGSAPADYIRIAFSEARKADPFSLLVYNDYNIEGFNAKSDAVFKLIKRLKSKGIPIDAVGLQSHFSTDNAEIKRSDIKKNIQRYANIDVKVLITEHDVRTKESIWNNPAIQQRYKSVISACLSEPNCITYVSWGLTSKYSWLPKQFPGYNVLLPFDSNLYKTELFYFLDQQL